MIHSSVIFAKLIHPSLISAKKIYQCVLFSRMIHPSVISTKKNQSRCLPDLVLSPRPRILIASLFALDRIMTVMLTLFAVDRIMTVMLTPCFSDPSRGNQLCSWHGHLEQSALVLTVQCSALHFSAKQYTVHYSV